MYQVVDAFDNDGWWVGQITGEYRNSYYVYFEHYDLIGRVVSIHQPKDIQVKQNSQRLIDFVIEDCRISSSYSATRVLFNYECPEVFAFKDRFLTPIRTISSRSRNTGSGSLETMSNESITMTSLMDIYDDKKVGEFWVIGEITDIQRDWYFIACANKGFGKKILEINDQMYCKSCDEQSPDEIIKYKLVIDVLDDEQDGQLILWDNVCSPLLGFTASELKGKYSEEGCMPNEIEGLIGKTMKFMIVTREDQFKYKGNAAFTVLGVQADEAKSNSFKKGEQSNVIRKLAEEKEFNENFGQVCTI
nr:replication protein A 70 kDa DNA-binding subunit B-like [Ipomoea batatas]GME09032.1 replication protein A 70 kDa DNA-binding subunit B-like [Ipomoea batatas]